MSRDQSGTASRITGLLLFQINDRFR